METVLTLSLNRPRCTDTEPRPDQRIEQGFPRLLLLVGKHNRQHAIVAEYPFAFDKGLRHHSSVKFVGLQFGFCALAVSLASLGWFRAVFAKSTGVYNCFLLMFAQVSGEPFWTAMALSALKPHVEKVGELRVLDVIGVRRIDYDRGDAAIIDLWEVGSRS